MARRTASNRKSPAPKLAADMAGNYAYRFAGFAVKSNNNHYLAGVGVFSLQNDGTLKGRHKASVMVLSGSMAEVLSADFDIEGSLTLASDKLGSAEITFTYTGTRTGVKNLTGSFHAVVGGSPNCLWLVSSKAVLLNDNGTPSNVEADELASLEAVRMT